MNRKKSRIEESMTFLWAAILFFLATTDTAFPFIMFGIKVILYLVGSIAAWIGIKTLYKSIFGRKKNECSDDTTQDEL